MKLFFYFFLLAAPLCIPQSLKAASETTAPLVAPSYFTHHWTGNESLKQLYFNISLVPGLEYPMSYTTIKFNNGQGCEILCKPQSGYKFETDKGVLEEMKITVELTNTLKINNLNYIIYTELKFKKSGIFTNTITTTTNSSSGVLHTTSVNLNERAQFITITDEPGSAVIIFKQI